MLYLLVLYLEFLLYIIQSHHFLIVFRLVEDLLSIDFKVLGFKLFCMQLSLYLLIELRTLIQHKGVVWKMNAQKTGCFPHGTNYYLHHRGRQPCIFQIYMVYIPVVFYDAAYEICHFTVMDIFLHIFLFFVQKHDFFFRNFIHQVVPAEIDVLEFFVDG